MEKCALALGLPAFDADVFIRCVAEIRVPEDGVLVFAFHDGTEQIVTWEHRSRRECWTAEMREVAREAVNTSRRNGHARRSD